MYWTLEFAGSLDDAPWPATKDELIDYANELGLPVFGPVDMTNPDASSQVVDYFDSVWSEGKAPIEDPDM